MATHLSQRVTDFTMKTAFKTNEKPTNQPLLFLNSVVDSCEICCCSSSPAQQEPNPVTTWLLRACISTGPDWEMLGSTMRFVSSLSPTWLHERMPRETEGVAALERTETRKRSPKTQVHRPLCTISLRKTKAHHLPAEHQDRAQRNAGCWPASPPSLPQSKATEGWWQGAVVCMHPRDKGNGVHCLHLTHNQKRVNVDRALVIVQSYTKLRPPNTSKPPALPVPPQGLQTGSTLFPVVAQVPGQRI